MNKKTIRDIDVAGKRVLVRVDFNVPLDAERHITDDTRIKAALPTINYLLDAGAAVILMSHLGRPDGKVVEKLSLAPVAQRLGELLSKPVQTASDSIGPAVAAQAAARCLRHCPSRARLDGGRHAHITGRRGLPARKRDQFSRLGVGKSQTSPGRHHRRRQGLR